MRCYIYEHIRLDTNEVFYVGRGTVGKRVSGKVDTNTYKRAYDKHTTNRHWIHVTNVTPYEVKILHDNLDWDESIRLERYYIEQYGRRDLGLGTLVNFTDGGEGTLGWIKSEAAIEAQRIRMAGPNNPQKRPDIRLKNSIRMKENNPMKRPEVTKQVVDHNKARWASGMPHPRKGKSREDLRQRNLTNNPAKSPEARKKISDARRAKDYRGGNSPVAKAVLDPATNTTYPSIVDCAKALGKTTTTIFSYLKKGTIKYA